MKLMICIAGIVIFFINGITSDHGIYLQSVANINADIKMVKKSADGHVFLGCWSMGIHGSYANARNFG